MQVTAHVAFASAQAGAMALAGHDKPKQDLPGGWSAMLQRAAKRTLITLYVQHLLLSGLERPFKHCSRLCELRPAAIVRLLPFSGHA